MSYYPPPGGPGYNPPMPGGPPPPGHPGGPSMPGGYQPYVPPPGPYVPAPPPGGAHPPGGGCPPPIGPGPNWMMPPPPEQNPHVPFERPLPMPGQDGLMIVLSGDVPPHCNRFHVNLSAGPGESAPIAIHVNPRFEGTNQVVRNSCSSGCWGEEERQGGFPFVQGRDFELIILFTNDAFKVAINGSHFCDFRYRMRKEDVTHVSVAGDVSIRFLRFQPPAQPMNPPPPYMPGPPMPGPPMFPPGVNPPPPQMPPPVQYNMHVPHEEKIHSSFTPGRSVRISGRPTGKRFAVNLCYHDSHKRDIAFHFNPRFDEKTPVVVRNTMAGYTWGKEERHQSVMPFSPGTHFDMNITCQKEVFVVDVNGQHFGTYSHRLRNLNFIKLLYIDGDVELSSVILQ